MSNSSASRLNIFSFSGNMRILHLTWIAFFISFFVWFNHAPLMASIRDTLGLTPQEVKTLLILNVALTIPARIIIGILVDKLGPRITYSSLLFLAGILCAFVAQASTFEEMAILRFMLGFVGAGFVIGIRMVGEWFPAKQVGVAEGIYGGWGNFGSAAAAMSLPTLALFFGGDEGWRLAMALTGAVAVVYSVIYFFSVTDTPKGSTYFKPNKAGAMEVTSKSDMILYCIMKLPLFLALALLNWKLGPDNLKILSTDISYGIYAILAALYVYQLIHIFKVNKDVLSEEVPEIHKYNFKQVAVLDLAYLVTFGSELAVVSMLPMFFQDTFDLSIVMAGLLASGFAFMNLVARPGGGLLSDKFGRRKTLLILLIGLSIGYMTLSQIDSDWFLPMAVIATMCCSFFVQAGEGAVFAMVPLIKRRMTGQIAGMVGAYGNVGAVLFLTVLSFVDAHIFFMVIAGAAIVTVVATYFWLDEPEGKIAEVMPDGTVQLIDVS
ncbi:Nitrite transporter subfamily [Candidatus Terasakiella magnetica]|uniref:Nitrate/nitrite transporter n=1 Tax=Candidatus Terasakiella magnetica TaxID=1867952 RepID=A0A1C3RHX6_9PROT|nr:NarK family nitrate/nitrite MFS transporter [Candidatus Terasakiella magnetica]SCA56855.1 Nitrite transporter subfamily [Candidatus Terasakiella magnetica]